jgi:hypothetical protein
VVLGIMGFFLLLCCLIFFFFFYLIRNCNSCYSGQRIMRFFIMFVHVLIFHVCVSILRYFQI